MNATKRKFNTLLQGLGTSRPKSSDDASSDLGSGSPLRQSTTKLSSQDTELLNKRRRLGFPEATAPRLGNTLFTSSLITRKPTQKDAQPKKDEPAKYSPSDRADLLKRLATFQEITDWTPKPDKVNEVEWAKRGWVCKGKETVRCLLCHKELLVKLNRKVVDGKEIPVLVPSEIEDALVDKYAELIVESHREDCLWRKRGCDDSILRLQLTNATSSLESLRQRYDELCTRKAFLPYEFNLRMPENVDVSRILSQLPPDFFKTPAPAKGMEDQPPNRVALVLALLGWQGLSNSRIGAVPNSASCHTCLRRLGLWMFKSKEVSDTGEVLVPAPMEFLDPVREHRFFCPWANAAAQSRGVSQSRLEPESPGWKVLLQTLTNDSHLRGVYEGRPRAKTQPESGNPPSTPQRDRRGVATPVATPQTGTRPGTAIGTPGMASDFGDGEVDEKERDAKDKERWARLKRVKSLFDSKGSRRLRHSISRPGTAHSTKSTKSTGIKDAAGGA